MSFFKKKDDNPDIWKDKYFKLLDTQDQFEKDQKANEVLLCKTIVRFALAVKGFNQALDPHLERIRDLLKTGLQRQELKKELDIFSKALMVMEDEAGCNQLDASLLFDFLEKQYPSHLAELEAVHQQYANREINNHQRLFLTLAEILEEKHQGQHDFSAELALSDSKLIGQQLIRLLENADLPDVFTEEGKQLKDRLQGGQSLVPVFEDAVTLLLSIKKHMLIEQQEMADFLASLTDDLANLGLKASGVNMANEDAQNKRTSLDNDLTAQMADLQRKSATATQVEPLKQLIGIRLHKITLQIQSHNLKEQFEREKSQRELRELVQQIRDMESETLELQSRLDLAQQRATRDPLTNLPNRLAFDDRLTDELARARRYGSFLTLAVWDIDFFKYINDTYGHKSGDKALVIISKLLSEQCRVADFVARFGGEEFVMLLPETDGKAAQNVVDKLREVIESSGFVANGKRLTITMSCGLTQYLDGDTSETLFVRADGALYQAKQAGRNQCILV